MSLSSFPYRMFTLPFLVILVVVVVTVAGRQTGSPELWGCHEKTVKHSYLKNELCFLAGISDNHMAEYMSSLASIQKLYPCAKKYLYNLGINETGQERANLRVLESDEFGLKVLDHKINVTDGVYFWHLAKVFKPPMILQFIDGYKKFHNCSIFMYLDSSVSLTQPLDTALLNELHRHGIVGQYPMQLSQQLFTHPGMYPYFGIQRNPLSPKDDFNQTQSGLILIDATNRTMRDLFFQKWSDCANNRDCITPENIYTVLFSRRDHYYNGSAYRVNRDDQSAFSFLMHNLRITQNAKCFLNPYTEVNHAKGRFSHFPRNKCHQVKTNTN